MKIFFKLCDQLVLLLERIAGVMFVAMAATTTWQVIGRYVLKRAAVWTGDLSLFLFVWIVMIGSAAAIYRRRHIAVTLVVSCLPRAIRRPVVLLSELITIACAVLLTAAGRIFFTNNLKNVSSGLPVSLGWPTASLVVGGALMAVLGVAAFCKTLTGEKEGAA